MDHHTMQPDSDDEEEYDSKSSGAGTFIRLYGTLYNTKASLPFTDTFINQFFTSLMNNLVFDLGFKGTSKKHRENFCWCPCGKKMNKIHPLLEADQFCNSTKGFGCNGFMDHLQTKGKSCALHSGILEYVTTLYGPLYSNNIDKDNNNSYLYSSFCF